MTRVREVLEAAVQKEEEFLPTILCLASSQCSMDDESVNCFLDQNSLVDFIRPLRSLLRTTHSCGEMTKRGFSFGLRGISAVTSREKMFCFLLMALLFGPKSLCRIQSNSPPLQ